MKTYDATLIFPNSLKDEELTKALDRVKEEVTRLSGEVLSAKIVGRRQFARPMKKRESGQYAKMSIKLGPQNVSGLTARLKLNGDVFRAQIVCGSDKGKPVEEKEAKETDGES